jgi:hypothetical protein
MQKWWIGREANTRPVSDTSCPDSKVSFARGSPRFPELEVLQNKNLFFFLLVLYLDGSAAQLILTAD